jgi:hypothetical protein
MAAHPRIGSPLQAGEIAGFEPGTAGLKSGLKLGFEQSVLINYTWNRFAPVCLLKRHHHEKSQNRLQHLHKT